MAWSVIEILWNPPVICVQCQAGFVFTYSSYVNFRWINMLLLLFLIEQYGVNVKHQEYFADSPSTGLDPASREEWFELYFCYSIFSLCGVITNSNDARWLGDAQSLFLLLLCMHSQFFQTEGIFLDMK